MRRHRDVKWLSFSLPSRPSRRDHRLSRDRQCRRLNRHPRPHLCDTRRSRLSYRRRMSAEGLLNFSIDLNVYWTDLSVYVPHLDSTTPPNPQSSRVAARNEFPRASACIGLRATKAASTNSAVSKCPTSSREHSAALLRSMNPFPSAWMPRFGEADHTLARCVGLSSFQTKEAAYEY